MARYLLPILILSLTSKLHAQINLSAGQWREDLRHFQTTVHEDYDHLFKKVSAKEFDAAVEELYEDIPQLQEHEIIAGFSCLVALFGYGHTQIGINPWYSDNRAGLHIMPFNLYWFNDGVYVQGVHRDYERALGARVIRVGSVPVKEALEAIRPAIPVENEMYFRANGPQYLGVPELLHAQGVTEELQSTVTLTLEKGGETFDIAFQPAEPNGYPGQYGFFQSEGEWLDARDQSETPLWLQQLDRNYFYEYLPEEKTVYVRHSKIRNDSTQNIAEFYEEVYGFIATQEVEKMVLDLRLNGGGNNYLNKPIVTGALCSKINQTGKFFVLIGRRTFSACQNLVNELDNYTNAVFVGEPTSENINFYGDNRREMLPNSQIPIYLSFAWWQDKPQWENAPWLSPDIAVDLSFADYQSNRDPVLEAVRNFEEEDLVVDPVEHLSQLFMQGKIEEVKQEAGRMVNDPRYKYYDFEDAFNQTGYNLLNNNNLEPALFVFQMNAELFPESANVWDSLGEAHLKAGNTGKAKEYYEKAARLDPEGSVGDNARRMLEKIKSR